MQEDNMRLAGTEQAAGKIQRVSYTHDAMVDAILANPAISNNELATMFGYTAAWMSQIKNSDAFQERLAARRKELSDPVLVASIEDKFRAVVDRGLDIIAEKMSGPASVVPADMAFKAIDIGARALGYGAKQDKGPAIQANFVVKLPDKAQSEVAWAAACGAGGVLAKAGGQIVSSIDGAEK